MNLENMKKRSSQFLKKPLNNLILDTFPSIEEDKARFNKKKLLLLLSKKRFDDAYKFTLKNIGSNIIDHETWYLMGISCRGKGDISSASVCLKNGLSINSQSINLIVAYCLNCIDQSLFEDSLTSLKNLNDDKDYPEISNVYALTYKGLKINSLALTYFIKVLRSGVSIENIFYNYATFLSSIGKHRIAIKYYKKFNILFPDNIDSLFNTSSSFISLRNFKDAKIILSQILLKNPDHLNSLMNIAIIQTMNTEYLKAKISYKEILSLSPNNLRCLIDYSNILFKLKDFNEAIRFIKKAVSLDTSNIEALNIYAASLYELKNYQDSIVKSLKVLELEPLNLHALMNIINAYYFSKDWLALDLYMNKLREVDACNPLLASLDPLFSYDQGKINKSNFIKNPLGYLKQYNIKDYTKDSEDLLDDLIDLSRNLPSEEDPIGKTTVKGLQTLPIIFERNNPCVTSLNDILIKCIFDYKDFYKDYNDLFIQQWPKQSYLQGWTVFLKDQGLQNSHNHLSGWLSGVIYLKIPKVCSYDNGSIKFSLHGYDYPFQKKTIPHKILEPITGSIILFPSSLYHSTIPFRSDDERISLAFDLLPGENGKRIGLGNF